MKHSVILNVFLISMIMYFPVYIRFTGSTVINCPNIAFLDTTTRIACSTSVNFTTTIYTCPCGSEQHCSQSGCVNQSTLGFNASIVNRTQTELTIPRAQPRHTGNWACSDRQTDGKSFCNLVLTKIPSVTITSDVDADSVNLEDRVSLIVDIEDYYCSGPFSLTLQVGSEIYKPVSGRNNANRNLTTTTHINVTQTHFGDVKLVFVCDKHLWNITPEGVHELQPNSRPEAGQRQGGTSGAADGVPEITGADDGSAPEGENTQGGVTVQQLVPHVD
ncbi:uncharacterized protein [Haliotis asinina]|uniref:uncharacterized protein n=1 Tax=Haliotis asinina TaxID=109174 RepID=UPI003531A339